jgi:hypothetical protein
LLTPDKFEYKAEVPIATFCDEEVLDLKAEYPIAILLPPDKFEYKA